MYALLATPSISTRTRCRFGLKRRLVATIEWLRLFPNDGFLPQDAQTLDTAADDSSGLALRSCAQLGEDVGHLEPGANRLGPLLEPVVRLVCLLEREDAERDRDARLERRQLEPGRGLAGDEVEVRRVAADDAAEGDDAGVTARLRERHRRDRKLERARDRHDRDRVPGDAEGLELRERPLEQPAGDVAVEAADDDPDSAPAALCAPFEDAVAVRHGEVAGGVLPRFGVGLRLLDDDRLVDLLELHFLQLGRALRLRRLLLLVRRILERRRLGPAVALAHASAPS